MRKMIGAVLVVVVALSVTTARAQTSVEAPEYLREMPSAEKVIGDLRVAGRRESVARAAFALEFLGMFIEQLSPHRHGGKWAPQESARMVEYENARRSLLAAHTTAAQHATKIFEGSEHSTVASLSGQSGCGAL